MPVYDAPNYVPNLWCWLKADAGVAVSGSTVTAWNDQSSNGRNTTIVGSPTRTLASLNGLATISVPNSSAIRTAVATSALTAAGTMIAVWKMDSASVQPLWDLTAGYWYVGGTTSPNGFSGLQASSNQVSSGNSWHIGTIRHGNTSSAYPGCGTPPIIAADLGSLYGEVTITGPTTGNALEYPRAGTGGISLAEILIYSRSLTHTEIFGLHRYLAARWGLWTPLADTASTCIIWQGCSTSRSGTTVAIPFAALDRSRKLIQVPLAIDSTSSADSYLQRDVVAQITSFVTDRSIPSILVYHQGQNESSDSVFIDAITDPNGAIQQQRRAGGRVLLNTSTPWNGVSVKETARQSWNAWMRTNWSTYADGIYDLGATAEFGIYDNGTPTAGTSRGDFPTYWSDAVHQTATGQAAKAALLEYAIAAMMGRVSLVSNAIGSVSLTHSFSRTGWTYQWYRYAGTFDPLTPATRGSALSGATSQTLTDTTVAANTLYSYSCQLTHATEGSAWSAAYAVTSKGGGASPARIFGGL